MRNARTVSILTTNDEIIAMYLRGEAPVFVLSEEETTADELIEAARAAAQSANSGPGQTRTPPARNPSVADLLPETPVPAEPAEPDRPQPGLAGLQIKLDRTIDAVLARSLLSA